MPQIAHIDVVFTLPTWICNHDYWKSHFYSPSHRWAGQVEKETHENPVFDRLWEELEYEESCNNAAGPWVRLQVAESAHPMLETHIHQMQAKIAIILAEFEENPCKD